MGAVKDCPHCNLVNPSEALRCDCGYDFVEGRSPTSHLPTSDLSTIDWVICIVLPVIGVIVGLVRSSQGKPAGGKMVGISVISLIVWTAIRFMILAASR